MLHGIEVWQLAAGLRGGGAGLPRVHERDWRGSSSGPSPSEAIIRIGRSNT